MPLGKYFQTAEIKDRKGLKGDKLVIYVRKISQKATDYFAVGTFFVNDSLLKKSVFEKKSDVMRVTANR